MWIGILVLPLYIKYLGAEAYGLIGFFTMLTSWMMLLDAGLTATLVREASRLRNKLKELKLTLRTIESMFLLISIIAVFIVYLAKDYLAMNWLDVKDLTINEVSFSIFIMGVIIGLRFFSTLYRGFINGFEHQIWINVFNIVLNTFKFVGGFIFVKYYSNEPTHFFEYQLFLAFVEVLVLNLKVYSLLLTNTKLVLPSKLVLRRVKSFTLNIVFLSFIGVAFTQADKLVLSATMPLSEYGYFTLVVVISNAILQFLQPIAQAVSPRMVSLIENKKELEMIELYHKSTRLVSILIFSIVGNIAVFSNELLFVWTGDHGIADKIYIALSLYVLGNGIMAVSSFQYMLQFAYGELKYHVRYNVIFAFLGIPVMSAGAYYYGIIGAGISWVVIQVISFVVWPTFVHNKFIPGEHTRWLFINVLPFIFASTFMYGIFYKFIDLSYLSRLEIFASLVIFGMITLGINLLLVKEYRKNILTKIKGF
jgi:O-antigen/teichoic acid export membrane protein